MRVNSITSSYVGIQKFSNNQSNSRPSLLSNNQNMTSHSNIQFQGKWWKVIFGDVAESLLKQTEKKIKVAGIVVEDNIDKTLKSENLIGENGKIKGFLKYIADSNGTKIPQMKIEKNPNGTIKTMTQYEYVPNSNYKKIAKTQNIDGNGNLQWETKYTYGSDNKIQYTENFDKDGNFLHKTEYKYAFHYDVLEETSDYNAKGELLNKIKYTVDDNYKKIKEIQYFDKSVKDNGKIYVFNQDDNLMEIKRYEQREGSFAPFEIKYYPSGKLKSEAQKNMANGIVCDGVRNKKEYYESGVLKYMDKENDKGCREFYEDGKLKLDKEIETFYTGSHYSTSSIIDTNYAPDGITKQSVLIKHPKDPYVVNGYEGSAKLIYSGDGKTVKEIRFNNSEHNSNESLYKAIYNDNGDLVTVHGISDSHKNFSYEKLKNINTDGLLQNVKEVISELFSNRYY